MSGSSNDIGGGAAAALHSRRLIILDRDGVINADSDDYIKSPEEFQPLPGSLEAIIRLKRAGRIVAIATNQSGLARGYFDESTLHAMHAKLREALAKMGGGEVSASNAHSETQWIDHIVHCPHGPDDGCQCRKPLPGMLNEILKRCDATAGEAVFIGDSLTDVQAARAAGVSPVLVRSGKGERTLGRRDESPETREILAEVPVFADLAAAVGDLLAIPVDELDG